MRCAAPLLLVFLAFDCVCDAFENLRADSATTCGFSNAIEFRFRNLIALSTPASRRQASFFVQGGLWQRRSSREILSCQSDDRLALDP
jgi:hypothetical protein